MRASRLLFVLAALALLLVVGAGGVAIYLNSPTGAPPGRFAVEPGQTVRSVADDLARAGFVRSSPALVGWLRLTGRDTRVGEGLYDLSGELSLTQVADRLAAGGQPLTVRVLIPEGFRIKDVARELAGAELGDEVEILAYLRSAGAELGEPRLPPGATLEGFLFPATYEFRRNGGYRPAVRQMVQRALQEIERPGRIERAAELGLSPYEWVVLASIVQAEAGNLAEKAVIAGVFLNRLDLRMGLNADPTVAYGLDKDLNQLDRIGGDFESDTPYNTYRYRGLPPGPISNPGAAALTAVLEPVRTNEAGAAYLYFLHGRDGGFYPNTNFQDHTRDRNRYLMR
jgi:UPF0755 protein